MKLKNFIPMMLLATASFVGTQSVQAQKAEPRPTVNKHKTYLSTHPDAARKQTDKKTAQQTAVERAKQNGVSGGVGNPTPSAPAAQNGSNNKGKAVADSTKAGGKKTVEEKKIPVMRQVMESFKVQHPNAIAIGPKDSLPAGDIIGDDPLWVEPFYIYKMNSADRQKGYDTIAVFSKFKHRNITTRDGAQRPETDSTAGGLWVRTIVKKAKDKEYDAAANTLSEAVVVYDENMYNKGANPGSTGTTALSIVNDRVKNQLYFGMDGYVFFSGRPQTVIDTTTGAIAIGSPLNGRELHKDTTIQKDSRNKADNAFDKVIRKEFSVNFDNYEPAKNWKEWREDAIQTILFNANNAFNEGKNFGGEKMPGLSKEEKGKVPYEYSRKYLKSLTKTFE